MQFSVKVSKIGQLDCNKYENQIQVSLSQILIDYDAYI